MKDFTSVFSRFSLVIALMLGVQGAFASITLSWPDSNGVMHDTELTDDAVGQGWMFDHKALGNDQLILNGAGPYAISGDSKGFNIEVDASCTLTLNGVDIKNTIAVNPITVTSGNTLNLVVGPYDNKLAATTANGCAGINVRDGGALVIDKAEGYSDSQCVVTCNGGKDSAGIGANDEGNCGTITINGGTVYAKGNNEASGIGGGNSNEARAFHYGATTINGGTVVAQGLDRAACIGTGIVQNGNSTVVHDGIYINGGTVVAVQENDARGSAIGLGEVSSGAQVTMTAIEITGGNVYAEVKNCRTLAENAAAAIGTGISETGSNVSIGRIAISGGEVIAKGSNHGAGIGCGETWNYKSQAHIGSIEISGGIVMASSGDDAAAIGTGHHYSTGIAKEKNVQEVGSIIISGGTVYAKGGSDSAVDIGVGDPDTKISVGTTVIDGGSVYADRRSSGKGFTNAPQWAIDSNNPAIHEITVKHDGSILPNDYAKHFAAGTAIDDGNGAWGDKTWIYLDGLPDYYGTNDVYSIDDMIKLWLPDGVNEYFNAGGVLWTSTSGNTDRSAARTVQNVGVTVNGTDIHAGSGPGWLYNGTVLRIYDCDQELVISGFPNTPDQLPVSVVFMDDGAKATFDGLDLGAGKVESGYAAVYNMPGVNAEITLAGTTPSTLQGAFGMEGIKVADGTTITINAKDQQTVPQLTVTGGGGAAGIGGGEIAITGGLVNVNAGAGAAAIDCADVDISGGTVLPTGNIIGSEDVQITGGSVGSTTPQVIGPAHDELGRQVYCVRATNEAWTAGCEQDINLLMTTPYGTNDMVTDINKTIYVWLPEDMTNRYALIDGRWHKAESATGDSWFVPVATGVTVDGEDVACGGSQEKGWTWDPVTGELSIFGKDGDSDHDFVVSGTSTDGTVHIVVPEDADVDLVFDDLDLENPEGPAVLIESGANVEIGLDDDNTVESGKTAAIQTKAGSELTIKDGPGTGTGTLNASADGAQNGAAGIGAGTTEPCGDITIEGGNIKATGGAKGGAGIGGGSDETADCGTITITDGTVKATAGKSGANDLGNGLNSEAEAVLIDGGSVRTTHGTEGPAVTNSLGQVVYCVTIKDANWSEGDPIEIGDVGTGDTKLPGYYGRDEIESDDEGGIYLWLPLPVPNMYEPPRYIISASDGETEKWYEALMDQKDRKPGDEGDVDAEETSPFRVWEAQQDGLVTGNENEETGDNGNLVHYVFDSVKDNPILAVDVAEDGTVTPYLACPVVNTNGVLISLVATTNRSQWADGQIAADVPMSPDGTFDWHGGPNHVYYLRIKTTILPPVPSDMVGYEVAWDENIYGLLRVPSTYANTIVATPWCDEISLKRNVKPICVQHHVRNGSLTNGDVIHSYNRAGGKYYTWGLSKGDWTPALNVMADKNGDPQVDATPGSDEVKHARGEAMWLKRRNSTRPFYLFGYACPRAVTNAVVSGTLAQPGQTMLGNPYPDPIKINDIRVQGTIGDKDTLMIPNGVDAWKYVFRNDGRWCTVESGIVNGMLMNVYDYDIEIPAGTGFWYVRRTEGELSLLW